MLVHQRVIHDNPQCSCKEGRVFHAHLLAKGPNQQAKSTNIAIRIFRPGGIPGVEQLKETQGGPGSRWRKHPADRGLANTLTNTQYQTIRN